MLLGMVPRLGCQRMGEFFEHRHGKADESGHPAPQAPTRDRRAPMRRREEDGGADIREGLEAQHGIDATDLLRRQPTVIRDQLHQRLIG